jgi:hypothetical protein
MVSTRAQSAAAVSRQDSSQDENSDETQTISSQNSFANEKSNSSSQNENSNLTSEGDQISSQNFLSQNFSFITSLIRQLIRPIFDETKEMSITNVLIKSKEVASLNESAD